MQQGTRDSVRPRAATLWHGWRWMIISGLLMVLPLLFWFFSIPLPLLVPPGQIVSFHALVEIMAIVVAFLVFATGFHVLDPRRSGPALMLACAFLAVALLDLFHLMSYPGMPGLFGAVSEHQTVIFWLAARLVAALAIGAYLLGLLHSGDSFQLSRSGLLLGMLLLAGVIAWVGIVHPDRVPLTFHPVTGLTGFKIAAEGAVILLHGLTLLLMYWHRHSLPLGKFSLLASALLLSIGGGFHFILYENMRDSHFVFGHLYKLLAYVLIYRCIFLESVRDPVDRLDQAKRSLAIKEARFHQMVETAPDGVMIASAEGEILLANRNIELMFDRERLDLIGRSVDSLIPDFKPEKHHAGPGGEGQTGPFADAFSGDQLGLHPDGSSFPVEIRSTRFPDEDGEKLTLFVRDITDRKQQEEAMHHQATHDDLTGLPNRWLLQDRLSQALAETRREDSHVAVLVMDVDNFKLVNDRFGHQVGDELLKAMADRLASEVRNTDTVARIGGDEFAIILAGLPSVDQAIHIVEKMSRSLDEPLRVSREHVFQTRASLGISFGPHDSTDGQALLRYADMAMYQAKQEEKGAYRIFSRQLDQRLQTDLALIERLQSALREDRLSLLFQPQIDCRSNQVVAVEALLRWEDEEFGQVPPNRFIPLAEKSGLVYEIDHWVLNQACRQAGRWQAAGLDLRVAINLSGLQFSQPDLKDEVAQAMAAGDVSRHLIELEITENAAVEDLQLARRQLSILREMGVEVALDDFGTGHSSLAHLKMLPVSRLKVDRMFVAGIHRSRDDARIFQAIVSLGRSLGMKVVAEGVETEMQIRAVRKHGCHAWQGWAGFKAMSAEEIEALLHKKQASGRQN